MPNQVHLEQIAERVERLLVRHAELQRTNALLSEQVESLMAERDSFKSRLGAARARVDALLDRLPHPGAQADPRSDGKQGADSNQKSASAKTA